jgi:hypothetical protein
MKFSQRINRQLTNVDLQLFNCRVTKARRARGPLNEVDLEHLKITTRLCFTDLYWAIFTQAA